MSRAAVFVNLVWLDLRWRFLLGVFALIACVMGAIFWWLVPLRDPVLIEFTVFELLSVSWFVGSLRRIALPYQLGLPISTRTLFLATLFVTIVVIWVPSLSVAAVLAGLGQSARSQGTLTLAALWTAGYSGVWLLWTKRHTAPTVPTTAVLLVLIAAGFHWLLHSPSPGWTSGLLAFSVLACAIALLRLPPAFKVGHNRSGGLRFAAGGGASLAFMRILVPWSAVFFSLVAAATMLAGNWPLQGLWIALLYWQMRAKDPLLLALPISQLRLVYARLIAACLVVWTASSLSPLSRLLLHMRTGFRLTPALLALTVALLLIGAAKLILWHRLQRWPKWALALVPISLFFLTITLSLSFHLTRQIAAAAPQQTAPAVLAAACLLLWLLAKQTRESDQHSPSRIPRL